MDKTRAGVWAVLLLMLGAMAVYAQRAPLYTWDLVPYLATVLERADHTPEQLHSETYAHLASVLPPAAYSSLVAGPYAAWMAEDVRDFVSQLPMYRVKPGYVWTLRLLHGVGVEPVAAIMLVSLVAGLALVGVLFFCLQRFLNPWLALLATALFIPAARLVDICRVPVPDNLSALLVLLGVLSLSAARWRAAGLVVLVLAVTVRINNIVYVALVLAWFCVAGYRAAGDRIDARVIGAGSALAASVVGYFAITLWQGHEWWRLFYHTLVAPVTNLDSFDATFSLPTWWGVVQSSLQQLLAGGVAVNTVLPLFLLIGLIGLSSPRGRSSELSVFIWLFLPTLLVYLLMFPLVPSWDRFFTPFYALVLIHACKMSVSLIGGISGGAGVRVTADGRQCSGISPAGQVNSGILPGPAPVVAQRQVIGVGIVGCRDQVAVQGRSFFRRFLEFAVPGDLLLDLENVLESSYSNKQNPITGTKLCSLLTPSGSMIFSNAGNFRHTVSIHVSIWR